jgi:hypothetical protein
MLQLMKGRSFINCNIDLLQDPRYKILYRYAAADVIKAQTTSQGQGQAAHIGDSSALVILNHLGNVIH